jgi:hypothetical protein
MLYETAELGCNMLKNKQLKRLGSQLVEYPDVSKLKIEV